MRIGPSIVCALALAAPLAAQAEIYRWVDDRGVINYSSVRPEGVKKVTQIAEDNGRVSTVPGMSQELLAQQRQLELEARIQRLERELYEQRARDAMAAAQSYPAYPYPAYSGYAAYPAFPVYGFGFVAARPVFPRHVRAVVPHAPVRHGPVRHAPVRGMRR
jgi:nucleotidyltransferase/DNA polymerase involved in DNA repair